MLFLLQIPFLNFKSVFFKTRIPSFITEITQNIMQSPVQGVAGGYRTWNHGLCSDMESGAQN